MLDAVLVCSDVKPMFPQHGITADNRDISSIIENKIVARAGIITNFESRVLATSSAGDVIHPHKLNVPEISALPHLPRFRPWLALAT